MDVDFAMLMILVLDAFFEKWRGAGSRGSVDLKEKTTIKVSLDGARSKNEIVEIYAGSGRPAFYC